jgi:hypothetical protein
MLVAIFLRILYRNSYSIRHLTAKGKDKTGLGIFHSVRRGEKTQGLLLLLISHLKLRATYHPTLLPPPFFL